MIFASTNLEVLANEISEYKTGMKHKLMNGIRHFVEGLVIYEANINEN